MPKDVAYTQLEIESKQQSSTLSTARKSRIYFHGWRLTVAVGALLTFLVFWTNIGLLIWAQGRGPSHKASSSSTTNGTNSTSGVITLFEGTCKERDSIIRWSHIGINALSTLLLGASSACMQVLSAPSRNEVDRCHARGIWLDIGVTSLRNLRWVSPRKVLLWAILGLTSIPLHLL